MTILLIAAVASLVPCLAIWVGEVRRAWAG